MHSGLQARGSPHSNGAHQLQHQLLALPASETPCNHPAAGSRQAAGHSPSNPEGGAVCSLVIHDLPQLTLPFYQQPLGHSDALPAQAADSRHPRKCWTAERAGRFVC